MPPSLGVDRGQPAAGQCWAGLPGLKGQLLGVQPSCSDTGCPCNSLAHGVGVKVQCNDISVELQESSAAGLRCCEDLAVIMFLKTGKDVLQQKKHRRGVGAAGGGV